MAKLMYLMNTSLDGYVEDEQGNFGWGIPDAAWINYLNETTASAGTYLYGRKMYDSMAYWETDYVADNQPPFLLDFATQWQSAEKIVYSSTLAEPRSARTRIDRTFNPDAVRQLKAESKGDFTINGPELAAHALRAGLVDQLQLFVWPVVVGGGKPFLPANVKLELALVEERKFDSGLVALRYDVRN